MRGSRPPRSGPGSEESPSITSTDAAIFDVFAQSLLARCAKAHALVKRKVTARRELTRDLGERKGFAAYARSLE